MSNITNLPPGSDTAPALNPLGQPIGPSVGDWQPPPPPPRTPLEGRFCCVEPLDPGRHAAGLYAAYALDAQGRTWTYLSYGPFATQEEYLTWMVDRCRLSDPLFHAILAGPARAPVGVAGYLRIAPASGSIEIGHLAFSPLLQRTPAATEAMYLMIERAFELGYRRCEWKCDALNAPSRAAAQRLGLSFEGVFRQAAVYKGRSRDTAWYAAIDREWPALEHAFRRWLDPANFDAQGQQRLRLSELTRPLLAQRG